MTRFCLAPDQLHSTLKYLNTRLKKEILYYKQWVELKQIISKHAMLTFFQPIMDLSTGETIGFEVLNRPKTSQIFSNTEQFYDFVGQTDQVLTFESYCRNLSLNRFFERVHPDCIHRNPLLFLNIHPHVLLDSDHQHRETMQLLQQLGLKPEQIVFELTEKSAVIDFAPYEKVLSNYRSQGFRIAVDDVGSGYNSLKTLVHFKPEYIKLDKSLTQHIDEDPVQQQLVFLLMEFSRKSGTFTIAEGIERVKDLVYLRESGVDYAQGYALGRPVEEIRPGCMPLQTM